jgi:hypothetical protein
MGDSELVRFLRKKINEIGEIQRRTSRSEQSTARNADDLVQILADFEETLGVIPEGAMTLPKRVVVPASTEAEEILEKLARRGVETIRIDWHANGSARIVVDGNGVVPSLSHMLAELLDLLQEDCGKVTDDLVGWKSCEYLRDAMARRTGKPCSKTNLTSRICRLRKALRRAGVNMRLVQNRGALGYRFACRSALGEQADVTQCDPKVSLVS